jgi:hypothetical protein
VDQAEVVVVGGGITAVARAGAPAFAGKEVAVLEASVDDGTSDRIRGA